MPNLNYDPRIIIASKEQKEVIHLSLDGKPLGRFCACGCGKRIIGQKVKRKNWRTGLTQEFFLPPSENQIFFNKSHGSKFRDKRPKSHKSKNGLDCRIKLNVYYEDGKPFRILKIYLKKQQSIMLKITPEYKELWEKLNNIEAYRKLDEKIIPTNLLSNINLKVIT